MPKQKDNSGALFVNEKRLEQAEGAPNAKGECLIDGVEYWISAWTNTGPAPDLKKYQSLRFERKENTNKPKGERTPAPESDDIPF